MHIRNGWVVIWIGLTACGDSPNAEGRCVRNDDCESGRCVDTLCVPPAAADGGGPSRDAGMMPPIHDDAGAAPERDSGLEPDAGPPPPLPPAFGFELPSDVEIRAMASLDDGVILAGKRDESPPTTSRRAVLAFAGLDGSIRWAKRIGSLNEQFFGAASRGTQAVAVGLTRAYSRGPTNDDILMVAPEAAGTLRVVRWGTAGDELLFAVAPGDAAAEFVGVGFRLGSARDGLVTAFDRDLTPLWALALGGAGADELYAVAASGELVVAAGQTSVGSSADAWIVGVRAGAVVFSATLGGPGADTFVSVEVDPRGGFVASGRFNDNDALITRWSEDGTLLDAAAFVVAPGTRLSVLEARTDSWLVAGGTDGGVAVGRASLERDTLELAPVAAMQTTTYLTAPVAAGAAAHLFAGFSGPRAVVMPFDVDLRAACERGAVIDASGYELGVAPRDSGYSSRAVALTGGAVASPTVRDETVTGVDPACVP